MATKLGTRFRESRRLYPNGYVKLGQLVTKQNGQQSASVAVSVLPSTSPLWLERTWDDKHPGPPFHEGGRFANIKALVPSLEMRGTGFYKSRPTYSSQSGGVTYEYTGSFSNPIFTGDPLTELAYTNAGRNLTFAGEAFPSMAAYGPKVYPKLRPKIEKASIGVAIAEMRDLPHMLASTSSTFYKTYKGITGAQDKLPFMHPKGAADIFLNQRFGWAPFLKDLEDLIRVYLNTQEYLARITRQNDKWVKKHWTFLDQTNESLINYGYTSCLDPRGSTIDSMCDLGPVHGGGNAYSAWELRLKTYDKVWAHGSFKYYRPEFDAFNSGYNSQFYKVLRYLTIYGVRVNPSVIYRATPWSWLVDWFIGLGNLVDRITDWGSDSIVARYMYLMKHTVQTLSLQETRYFATGAKTFTFDRILETKRRDEAESPYGFDLQWGSLSLMQLAILGALGISRKIT